ncbi:MAG: M23 family metallopeptidase [Spirochaetes bacterium]|nr:M23 family metallopeptidase [Spirochaetota bacterium]
MFFVVSVSINAKVVINSERAAYPGGLIRVFALSTERIENFHVVLNREDGTRVARFEGFRFNPRAFAEFKDLNIYCMVAIVGTGSTLRPGNYKIAVFINNEESYRKIIPVVIKRKDFFTQTIRLNRRLTNLRTDPSERRQRESQELWRLLSTFNRENVFTSNRVIKPITATPYFVTSRFGSIRRFVYSDGTTADTVHHGIDYATFRYSRIYSCASGRIAFAGYRLITGYTVIIEHLPGLYSLYYHLDRIFVTEGMFVPQGAVIGRLGNTGLSTGPHLHWEIRNQTKTVNPAFLMANPMIDKNKIINIIRTEFMGNNLP